MARKAKTHHHEAEVIVVGGGPAGLSAAIYLARYGRSVALFDMGHGRSTHHQVNRNYLGFPGGTRTTELRQRGLDQLRAYEHVYIGHHKVERLERTDGGCVVSGQFGDTSGRAVILAMGVLDHYPHFRDWESYVGISMFWCITCDGYESRDKKIVVAGHTNDTASEALQLTRLSDDITLITNSHVSEIDDRFASRLAAAGIPVLHDKIHDAQGTDGQLEVLETTGGLKLPVEALFVVQRATPPDRAGEHDRRAACRERLHSGGYRVEDERRGGVRRRRHHPATLTPGERGDPRGGAGSVRGELLSLPRRVEGRLTYGHPSKRPALHWPRARLLEKRSHFVQRPGPLISYLCRSVPRHVSAPGTLASPRRS